MKLLFSLLLLFFASFSVGSKVPSPVIDTVAGPIQGYTDNSVGLDYYLGIPYAAPPVGANRLRSPQPVTPWTSTLQTVKHGQICKQIRLFNRVFLGGEDCLYLNVVTPTNHTQSSELLPVFVWIYGGGFDLGDGYEFGFYDPTNIASKHNMIVVTLNYRLGPMGFLALNTLKAESSDGSVGNYGFQDQQAALTWVQDNIKFFGGNPERVTVAGESAGAMSSCAHIASPASAGTFSNIIMESGTCDSPVMFQPFQQAAQWGQFFAQNLGCGDAESQLECLRALDETTFMGPDFNDTWPNEPAYVPPMFPVLSWGPTVDGVVLPDFPLRMIEKGQHNRPTSVIMGTNRDEGTLFTPRLAKVIPGINYPIQENQFHMIIEHFFHNASLTNDVLTFYPWNQYANATYLTEIMLRDFFFVCSSSRALRALTAQGSPTYLYQFTYLPDWIEIPKMGVYHSVELEFVWDNAWPPLIHSFSARDQSVADMFGAYWSSFVYNNNPNGGSVPIMGLPTWPVYDSQNTLQHLQLDLPPQVLSDLRKPQCDFWDTVQVPNYPSTF